MIFMMDISSSMLSRTATLILIATSCGSYCVIWILKRHFDRNKRSRQSYEQIPTVWKQIGCLTDINIYPLKSGHHSSVDKAFCDWKGLSSMAETYSLSDRCFIIFKRSQGKYISNIQYNQLVRVKVTALNKTLIQFTVHKKDTFPPLTLDMEELSKTFKPSSLHTIKMYEKDIVHAFDCGDAASTWFSTFLLDEADADLRLGFDCDEQRRLNGTIYEKYKHVYGKHISNEDMGKFSYFASYMVMNETSVEDLNERLKLKGEQKEVDIHNFRGNLTLSADFPYEEDDWEWLRINQDVVLRVMKPCTRCKMTCLDPTTGEINPRLEPLTTLRSYRGPLSKEAKVLERNSPRLGLYCGLYRQGTVQTGDPVYVGTSN